MAGNLWKRIDIVENPPSYLVPEDICFYARDYIPGVGYSASEANNLMNNFKKPKSTQDTAEWEYKKLAIQQLANELSEILPAGARICSIPSSRTKQDPDYDPRFDMLFECMLKDSCDIKIEEPIACISSTLPAHLGGSSRDPDDIKNNYVWVGFSDPTPEELYIIDDVITSGGHFKACQSIILENNPAIQISGLFFCKTVHS